MPTDTIARAPLTVLTEEVDMGRYTHGFLMVLLGVIVVRDCQAQTASGSVTDPASASCAGWPKPSSPASSAALAACAPPPPPAANMTAT